MTLKIGLLGKKIGMTHVYADDGEAITVTVIQAGPCHVVGTRTQERVHKGKRMAGQMGNEKVSIQNLQLFRILDEDNVILVRGSIPGANNDYVVVTNAATRTVYKRKRVGKEEVRSKNPLKASKKA